MAARAPCAVRSMRAEDMPALLDLWVESWQAAYPSIDFRARRGWADSRLAELQRDGARILVVEAPGPNIADPAKLPFRKLRPGMRTSPGRH